MPDLHVVFEANRRVLDTLRPHPDDWQVLAGDFDETLEHVEAVLRASVPRFAAVAELLSTLKKELDCNHAPETAPTSAATSSSTSSVLPRQRAHLIPRLRDAEWIRSLY